MFESCSAYHNSRPHILFLSHCVPNPPNKGEKIRAHHVLKALAIEYRIHLACLARSSEELQQAEQLSECCESVHAVLLRPKLALIRAGVRFTGGACLNEAFYQNEQLRRKVYALARRVRLAGAFVYTAVMTPYVPPGVPVVLDFVDVDCEKWADYAQRRRPKFLYATEARRMQEFERACTSQAKQCLVTTENEARVLRGIAAPTALIVGIENGVDIGFFDGQPRPLPHEQAGVPFVTFIGSMDYYPNIEAAHWFHHEVFLELRRRVPGLEFWIIGRNPARSVLQLRKQPNVRVLGGVSDVRPYLWGAAAVVAPLQLARGIQNKVLEALGMGRRVFASDAVCRTFGSEVPAGVVRCSSSEEFVMEIVDEHRHGPASDEEIRNAASRRFSWTRNMAALTRQFSAAIKQTVPVAVCSLPTKS